jgi:hypothetical protein
MLFIFLIFIMVEEVSYILWYLNKVKVEISMVCRNQWEYFFFLLVYLIIATFVHKIKKHINTVEPVLSYSLAFITYERL